VKTIVKAAIYIYAFKLEVIESGNHIHILEYATIANNYLLNMGNMCLPVRC